MDIENGSTQAEFTVKVSSIPNYHRRFQQLVEQGLFQKIAHEFVQYLYERGLVDIREAFTDGTFIPVKKGGLLSARQSVAKRLRSSQLRTFLVFLSPLTWKMLLPTK